MQTTWNAFGLGTPADNMILADVYVAYSCWVVLSDTPGIPTVVQLPFLPAATAAVRLWTSVEQVWYAVDGTPGPIPVPMGGTSIPDNAFRRGDVLKPGQEQICALPDTSTAHTLQLVSASPSVQVLVTALTEIL